MKMEMSLYRTVELKRDVIKMHGSYIKYMPKNEKEAGILKILSRYGLTLKKDITHKANLNCYWIGKERGKTGTHGIKLWDVSVPFLMRGLNKLLKRGVISEEDCGRMLCSIMYLVDSNNENKVELQEVMVD